MKKKGLWKKGICPLGRPYRECDPNPCHVHKCTNKKAFCEPNHCGGCTVDFFDQRGFQITHEECYGITKRDSRALLCRIREATTKCEAHPNALSICGNFYKYGRRLLPHECSLTKIPETCADGSKPCKEDPCKQAICNTTSSTVICVPDYCKCSYHFVNQDNERITCHASKFKPEETNCHMQIKKRAPIQCHTDPCKTPCRAHPEAICMRECGSCSPTYYDRKGNRLDRDQCS